MLEDLETFLKAYIEKCESCKDEYDLELYKDLRMCQLHCDRVIQDIRNFKLKGVIRELN